MYAGQNNVTKYKIVVDEQRHRETVVHRTSTEIDAIRECELRSVNVDNGNIVGVPVPTTYRIRCIDTDGFQRWEVVKDETYSDIRVVSTCDSSDAAANVQRATPGSRIVIVMEVKEEVKPGYFTRLWNALTDV